MLMKQIICLLSLLFFGTSNIFAGTTGAVLDLTANAYEKSLSYGGVAICDDIGGISYNPSVVANIDYIAGTFTYLNYIEDINMLYGNFIYPRKKFNINGRFGIMYMPSIIDYETGKELHYRELFIGGGTGYRYNKNLSFGANLNLYSVTIAESSGISVFINLGANYKTSLPLIGNHKVVAGVSILNLGPGIEFNQQRSSLPTSLNLGIKYIYNEDYRILFGMRKETEVEPLLWSMGGEILMFKFLSARISSYSDINNKLKFNMGIGIKIQFDKYNFIFDYTALPLQEVEYSNLITLTFRFATSMEKSKVKWESVWEK